MLYCILQIVTMIVQKVNGPPILIWMRSRVTKLVLKILFKANKYIGKIFALCFSLCPRLLITRSNYTNAIEFDYMYVLLATGIRGQSLIRCFKQGLYGSIPFRHFNILIVILVFLKKQELCTAIANRPISVCSSLYCSTYCTTRTVELATVFNAAPRDRRSDGWHGVL